MPKIHNSQSVPNVPKIIRPEQSSSNDSMHSSENGMGIYLDVPCVANGSDLHLSNTVRFSTGGDEEDHDSMHSSLFPSHRGHKRPSSRGSTIGELIRHSDIVRRTSHVMLDVPVENMKKIVQTKSVNSLDRETKHFANTTTMHGPKRMYFAKGWGIVFWVFMVALSFILLMVQVGSLVSIYLSRPVVSQSYQLEKETDYLGPSMFSGRTHWSNCSAVRTPSLIASSFKVVPFLCAV
ncbi:hypothetical protein WR25_15115 [Diploscapter pachys]|uniref:Uncharacterized protein n=1 Tax=Diploscapter pachys TaxID=2018661 RepID=A0A2A2LML9_9BILA|nr:hypothetical protein WR25_15115 [Diploscapter pachys]